MLGRMLAVIKNSRKVKPALLGFPTRESLQKSYVDDLLKNGLVVCHYTAFFFGLQPLRREDAIENFTYFITRIDGF